MWTAEIVRARFVEAADVERRSPLGRFGPSEKTTFWPEYVHSFADMSGWGSKRLAEEREMRFRRLPPSADAISRYDEVLCEWTPKYVVEDRRRLVWFWAFSAASGHSFSRVCRAFGWQRRTAYDRLERLFVKIAGDLDNDQILLKPTTSNHCCATSSLERQETHTIGQRVTERTESVWSDLPEQRDFSWAQHQAERRAKIEAKKRRKLGLEPAPVGA